MAVEPSDGPSRDAVVKLKEQIAGDLTRLTKLFNRFDLDGSGAIDKVEFQLGILSLLQPEGNLDAFGTTCDAIFEEVDIDASGTVNSSEFVRFAVRDALGRQRGRMRALFKLWDVDSSGALDKEEWRAAIKHIGFVAPQSDVDALFDIIDEDRSGHITFGEIDDFVKPSRRQGLLGELGPSPGIDATTHSTTPVAKLNVDGRAARQRGRPPTVGHGGRHTQQEIASKSAQHHYTQQSHGAHGIGMGRIIGGAGIEWDAKTVPPPPLLSPQPSYASLDAGTVWSSGLVESTTRTSVGSEMPAFEWRSAYTRELYRTPMRWRAPYTYGETRVCASMHMPMHAASTTGGGWRSSQRSLGSSAGTASATELTALAGARPRQSELMGQQLGSSELVRTELGAFDARLSRANRRPPRWSSAVGSGRLRKRASLVGSASAPLLTVNAALNSAAGSSSSEGAAPEVLSAASQEIEVGGGTTVSGGGDADDARQHAERPAHAISVANDIEMRRSLAWPMPLPDYTPETPAQRPRSAPPTKPRLGKLGKAVQAKLRLEKTSTSPPATSPAPAAVLPPRPATAPLPHRSAPALRRYGGPSWRWSHEYNHGEAEPGAVRIERLVPIR